MKAIFSQIAQREMEDAVVFCELEFAGLGARFKEETRKAARRIAEYPQAWPVEKVSNTQIPL